MSRPEPDFTMDELLEELSRYFQEEEEDSYSTREIAERIGQGKDATLRKLKVLLRDGRVEVTVKRVERIRDRALVPVTAWRLRREERVYF